ncbi:MAG: ferredoxin family protein [Planctomycetaceae bacterium]|nr:ferredoxin family protein [Planctomycetaceae bacterium]
MAKRIAVVVSQGQSAAPAKRQLEEDIVAALLMEPGIDVVVVPHLYDLKADGTGILALRGIMGNMIVLSWLYERGARWTLDRAGIRGKEGLTTIKAADDEDEEEENEDNEEQGVDDKERVNDSREIPNRKIYCLDLRVHSAAQPYIDEVKRIARENSMQLVSLGIGMELGGRPKTEQLARLAQPTNDTALPLHPHPSPLPKGEGAAALTRIDEELGRRWYPVIDYSRCTNCMECIDFCLFGVYGVDKVETILVEQPDNCRKGCPACSRVCPENAIIFPQHKTPTIAGASIVAESLKIDLSKLFGAPETGETAEQAAVRERDEQLVLAGREAVGASVGLPKRHEAKSAEPKDELDSLIDALDKF